MRRAILGVLFGGAVFLAGSGAGCKGSSGTGGAGGDQGDPTLADVVFEGGATDEALGALIAATPATTPPTLVANFTSPTNNAMVASSPAPRFTWARGAMATDARPVELPAPLFEREVGPRAGAGRRGPFEGAARSIAEALLAGIPEAHAHGTPMSGTGYFVLFTTTKNDKLLRVFTSATEYTPDAASLAKLQGAGEAIHAVVTNADFDQNRIAQDGGPYKGAEIVFTLQ